MKTKLIALFLSLLTMAFAVEAQTDATKKDEKTKPETESKTSYTEILTKVKNGDTNIDFKALRMAFTETKEYSYHGIGREERDKMLKAFSEKKYKDALKQAEKILEENYVEPNAHYVAYNSAKELKDEKKAEFHKAVLVGLLNSIQNGNDGLSAKTAFAPITIDEEYTLMKFMGYKHNSQALKSIDGHQFDVFEAVNYKTNEKVTLYFNIDVIWKAETEIFGK